jgi:thiamine biosynthesis lipoprotein
MPSNPSNHKPKLSQSAELHFEAIGTQWYIELFETDKVPPDLITDIQQTIDIFDSRYSRFREDSFVTLISHETGSYILPDDAKPLFDLYAQLYAITGGLMTPMIGRTLSAAGYDAQYSLTAATGPAPAPAWDEAIAYSFPSLVVKNPVLLDFGAAGKGYLVDIVSELIEKHGFKSYLVNASGDMRHRHVDTLVTIGLEHPDELGTFIGTMELGDTSLCGSAGNRRAWGKTTGKDGDTEYNHIMNPHTSRSPKHIKAVWAVADTTLLADALTTALYFVQPEQLRAHFAFEYAIVDSNYSLEKSAHFPAEFYVQ